MIILSGTLHVNSQNNLLHCSLGRFVIDDGRFHNLPVGKHDGFFEIQKIEATVMQKSQGQVQLGLLAIVRGFSIKTEVNRVAAVEARSVVKRQLPLFVDTDLQDCISKAVTVEASVAETACLTENSENLLNENEPLPETVELDSTLPREQLRQKIAQLQLLGYRFEKDRQLWQRAA
ncbi:MAG TPA: DUF3275 family protein [Gammaproteobacteria bacterium]|nr:DUF3275 family protein [Gammaproteobacteria bacterium]HVY53383.1 DUF3275 family protein [Gammaproteobacteria bacterium]